MILHRISVISKKGTDEPCGDWYACTDDYIAVIDGATPKGKMLWDGMKGDVYVSHLLAEAIKDMDPSCTAEEAVRCLNLIVRQEYEKRDLDWKTMDPEERLQCSLLVFSVKRKEIWSFGDCMFRINDRTYAEIKEGDRLLAGLRALCIQAKMQQDGTMTKQELSSYGRNMILPFYHDYTSLANRDVPFGYDVINGAEIHAEHVRVYEVHAGDRIILSSDGYPELFDTFKETEAYLRKALAEDPMCIGILQGTKGIAEGNESYDDRTYISLTV